MNMGTLITVYRGHDIRDHAKTSDGISMGVAIWKDGAHIGDAKNTTQAKNLIDMAIQKANEAKTPAPATNATPATPVASVDERKARNAKLMGRHENNPDDLI